MALKHTYMNLIRYDYSEITIRSVHDLSPLSSNRGDQVMLTNGWEFIAYMRYSMSEIFPIQWRTE